MGKPGIPARLRFTGLYGGLFLLSGIGLLALTNLFGVRESVPVVPPSDRPGEASALAVARGRIAELTDQLATVQADQARQLLIGSAIALVVMAVVSVGLGRVVADRVLRPLRAITAATRRITADNLHERLAVDGPADEVKDLADTVDDLLERLEGAFTAQRRFVANASHELRTPLTTMRASLDVAMAKPEPIPAQTAVLADRLRTELDLVERLLEGFLTLARAQHDTPPDLAPVSLDALVTAALDARAPDIADKGLTVDTGDVEGRTDTLGSPTLLSRLVDNAVDNAVRHNHEGGWIRVAVSTYGPRAVLVVETGGPVLDDAQVARLAEPFRRLGTERTGSERGSGLGLSIVAAIATAHGGRLDLRARSAGGLRLTVVLPAVPAAVPV
jgi:signal transduction histidine kinase